MITKDFVLAGCATFTVESPDGSHRTYLVERVEPSDKFPRVAYFVKTLTGPNNESDYTYLGKLNLFTFQVETTSASRSWNGTMRLRLLNRILARVAGNDHDAYERHGFKVHHAGKCGRCGRKLTTPDSIECGIGPECRKILGIVTTKPAKEPPEVENDFGRGILDTTPTTVKQKDVNYFRLPVTVA